MVKRDSDRGMFAEPFGQADCESELETLRERYSEFYFEHSPFNEAALNEKVYLIVGRRGSGKTALSEYFSFQKRIPNPVCIEIHEPSVYQEVLAALASRAPEARVVAVPALTKVWEFVIWSTIFHSLKTENVDIQLACEVPTSRLGRVSDVVKTFFEHLTSVFHDGHRGNQASGDFSDLYDEGQLEANIARVLEFAQERQIIVAMDTLEKYDIREESLMTAMAALVQYASKFNLRYAYRGVHLKLFLSGEVFPYLKETVLLNPLKNIKHPLYLLWRPKELLQLITWRFWRYLTSSSEVYRARLSDVNWSRHKEVFERMWKPFFGSALENRRGRKERTFVYVLRHTQMRPRQLIFLCNTIANDAILRGDFPTFSPEGIREAVKKAEADLANEILNSYELTYPSVARIVQALLGMPMIFDGSELDKRAKDTRGEWPDGEYSLANFRQLVAELGIVGRVKDRNDAAGFLDAEFEYSAMERLAISPRDQCAIHPMFYSKLNIKMDQDIRVMPFSVERGELEELQEI
ncbi:MAG TPA: hypothetical protein VNN25_12785 [Thermoanaerobaculia bacterium]|nr:hypothetical protein [Thermoanaerobaculia bacterium]